MPHSNKTSKKTTVFTLAIVIACFFTTIASAATHTVDVMMTANGFSAVDVFLNPIALPAAPQGNLSVVFSGTFNDATLTGVGSESTSITLTSMSVIINGYIHDMAMSEGRISFTNGVASSFIIGGRNDLNPSNPITSMENFGNSDFADFQLYGEGDGSSAGGTFSVGRAMYSHNNFPTSGAFGTGVFGGVFLADQNIFGSCIIDAQTVAVEESTWAEIKGLYQ